MIWLTWRQFRAQTLVAGIALVLVAIALAVTGPQLAHLYTTSGVAGCRAQGDCGTAATNFLNSFDYNDVFHTVYFLTIALVFAVPGVIGVFWGAPLITREIEAGTFRLAWTQSVTRTRWLAAKLGLIGLVAMATAGLLSLMVTWWASPIQRIAPLLGSRSSGQYDAISRFEPLLFGARGIAPVGYALFAFVLGVTVGVLLRRTLLAMAVTLVVFLGVQILVPLAIRPHFVTPVHSEKVLQAAAIDGLETGPGGQTTIFTSSNLLAPGVWVLSVQTIRANGQPFDGPAPRACDTAAFQACATELADLHLRQLVTYQPGSRYWLFQWLETLMFVALAALLAGLCFCWIRWRRLS